jgi:dipeptidyl aminopeptidase/acylaminoacyl peptidase
MGAKIQRKIECGKFEFCILDLLLLPKYKFIMKQILILFLGLQLGYLAHSQENLTYQKPPEPILALAEAETAPSVMMDTKKEYMILRYRSKYKTLSDLNQEEMRLGGLRINPMLNISSTMTYNNNLKIKNIKTGVEKQVSGLPAQPKIAYLSWSKDESKIAFTHTTENGVELWLLDVANAEARKLTNDLLNANLGQPFNWLADNQHLLIKVLPKNRPALLDPKKNLPTGPFVSKSEGTKSQNRTYTDLLKNPMDEQNFDILTTSELHLLNINGTQKLYKNANIFAGESISPDGQYIMITTIQKPYSYIVPLSRFPQTTDVYDLSGNLIKNVNSVPLTEIMPKGFSAVRKGKRSMGWRSDEPATWCYVMALDEGDPEKKVDFRDEVFCWKAPFDKEPTSILKTKQRFASLLWCTENLAIASDYWYDTRNSKTYAFNPENSSQEPKVIFDRNEQDVYSDPGNFETRKNEYGRYVIALENNKAWLIGDGYSKEGQFPFIDQYDFKTYTTKRLYRSSYTQKKENILSIEDFKKGIALVMIESKNEYPNYYFRTIGKKETLQPITTFANPFESIKDVYKEVIKYKRNDGLDLSGTLYLPAGYDRTKKEKLPLLIWAYPEEFKDKNSAGQSKSNPNEFTYPSYGSFIYWVTMGYAVLDDASFPIIGEGKQEPNDTFIPQLVANGEAAIQAVEKLGYIDPKRVAVGGHSYGAFMTANLLTHSKLFKCGIARSGAYNRTLTPFGFQSEQRNYWDAPEVYNGMSPFMQADKMKTPLLLVHGEADNNPGTFTLQTERYFQALKGLGAPAKMLILPKESHGYAAKENILHLLWEQHQFLETHLKK